MHQLTDSSPVFQSQRDQNVIIKFSADIEERNRNPCIQTFIILRAQNEPSCYTKN